MSLLGFVDTDLVIGDNMNTFQNYACVYVIKCKLVINDKQTIFDVH